LVFLPSLLLKFCVLSTLCIMREFFDGEHWRLSVVQWCTYKRENGYLLIYWTGILSKSKMSPYSIHWTLVCQTRNTIHGHWWVQNIQFYIVPFMSSSWLHSNFHVKTDAKCNWMYTWYITPTLLNYMGSWWCESQKMILLCCMCLSPTFIFARSWLITDILGRYTSPSIVGDTNLSKWENRY